ncbi:MAG: hypothetical protein AAF850_00585 [Pseudomonadota bacterium]
MGNAPSAGPERQETVKLRSSRYALEIVPKLGATILSLTREGDDILRSSSLEDCARDPCRSACFPCVPYFGRLPNIFSYGDVTGNLAPTLPSADTHFALHGEACVSAWRILSQHTDQLALGFDHDAKAPGGFPFPYRAEYGVSLTDNAATLTLRLKNIGEKTMPAGLGLHPYFRRLETTRVTFKASQYWRPPDIDADAPAGDGPAGRAAQNDTQPRRTPLGGLSDRPDAIGGGGSASLPGHTRDNTYLGFHGIARIEDDHGVTEIRSTAPMLHLYAPENADFFCLEPVTHAPGAFLSDDPGLAGKALGPGEQIEISLSIV